MPWVLPKQGKKKRKEVGSCLPKFEKYHSYQVENTNQAWQWSSYVSSSFWIFLVCKSNFLNCFPLSLSLFFFFLGLHPLYMEVPRLRVELELQLPAYATATATPDPRLVCITHDNANSLTRDQTHIIMDAAEYRNSSSHFIKTLLVRFRRTSKQNFWYSVNIYIHLYMK